MLDSVVRVNKKYYPQTLFEECKCQIKKTRMENLINDLEPSSSDDDNESDNESDSESDNVIESDYESKKNQLYFNNNKNLIMYVNRANLC